MSPSDRQVVVTYRVLASALGGALLALIVWTYVQGEARRERAQEENVAEHREIRAIMATLGQTQQGLQEVTARLVTLAESQDKRVDRLENHVLDDPKSR